MSRKNIGSALDRENLIKHNDNYTELYEQIGDITGQITDEVYDEIRKDVKLNWKEPVDTVDDLPSDAETGDTRMVKETKDGVSPVYRFNGSEWIEIQGIDATAITEVDERLQAEIDKKETPEGAQEKADTAEANAKEEIDKLEKNIMDDDGEVVKVVESGSNANGEYIRYSDGMQYCWGEFVGKPVNTKKGSIYYSDSTEWSFPKEFKSRPVYAAAGVQASGIWADISSRPTINNVFFREFAYYSEDSSYSMSAYAIGRWK